MKAPFTFIVIVLFVTCFSIFVFGLEYQWLGGIDDAYIYFVYARNLVEGHGLVYNPGGERVEGFTSVLWLLVTAGAYLITPAHFQFVLFGLNILLISLALYRMVRIIVNHLGGKQTLPSATVLFFLALVFIPKGFTDWTIVSLLDTGIWTSLLLLLSCHLIEMAAGETKSRAAQWMFAAGVGLLVFTRPESLLWGLAFVFLAAAITWVMGGDRRAALTAGLRPLILYAVCVAGLTLFRLSYFGYPLPNTYYAKMSSNRWYNLKEGLVYFFKYIYVYPLHFLAILVWVLSIVLILRKGWKEITSNKTTRIQALMVALMATALVTPLLTGGDHFALFRMYQPAVPLFFLVVLHTAFFKQHFFPDQSVPVVSGSMGAIMLCLALPFIYLSCLPKYLIDGDKMPHKASMFAEFSFAAANRQESEQLNRMFNFQPKPSIGRLWAGGYAYGYEGATVDLLGLNNTTMAHATQEKVGLKNHAAFNKDAFYKIAPDLVGSVVLQDTTNYVMAENTPRFDQNFENNVLKHIFLDAAFIKLYTPVIITEKGKRSGIFTYAHKNYLDSFQKHNLQVTILTRKERKDEQQQ